MTGPICQPGPNDAFLSRDQGKRVPRRPAVRLRCPAERQELPGDGDIAAVIPRDLDGHVLLAEKVAGGTGEEAVPGCPARRISPVGAAESRERVRVWTGERFPAASSVHTRRVYTPSPGRERTASEENGSAGVGTEPV